MKRKKLRRLLDAVNAEISKAELHYKENRLASQKMSETSRTSWSSAGDREYALDQEEVTKLNLEMLRNLSRELENAVEKEIPEEVQAPCFVRVYIDGEDLEFYLIDNVASVEGFRIVSIKSPVGEKIIKKQKYDTYKIAEMQGKIIGIE